VSRSLSATVVCEIRLGPAVATGALACRNTSRNLKHRAIYEVQALSVSSVM